MADKFNKQQRSFVMSKIRSKDTKPELILRKFLFSKGFRYRIHQKNLLGKPDIVLKKFNVIIEVNGCFWHGHTNCKLNRPPSSNVLYWGPKIAGNIARDKCNYQLWTALGWRVITVWECELKAANQEQTCNRVLADILKEPTHQY